MPNYTDQTIIDATSTLTPTKPWRPIRDMQPIDTSSDQIQRLQSQVQTLDNAALPAAPAHTSAAPTHVTGVHVSATPVTVGGVALLRLTVTFARGLNFAYANVYMTGYTYGGLSGGVLLETSGPSPDQFDVHPTSDVVTITVVAYNASGVGANFATAPTYTITLDAAGTAPPPPTIFQYLVPVTGGWQFQWVADGVADHYKIYRSLTTTPPGSSFATYGPPVTEPAGSPHVYQDLTAGATVYHYWVSAVSASGLESVLTYAEFVAVPFSELPSTFDAGNYTNPADAFDSDDATAAYVDGTSSTDPGSVINFAQTWGGFDDLPVGATLMSITLNVEASSDTTEGDSYAYIFYSPDNGASWFLLNTGTSFPYAKAWFTATIDPADLPATNQLSAILVRAQCFASPFGVITGSDGGDPVYTYFPTEIQHNIFEIRLDVTYHA